MGGGSWDTHSYTSNAADRKANKVDDFAYTRSATKVHKNLDPLRINKKADSKLESRDSKEHPNSTPVLISFDVTGSNINRAVVAQKKLPALMDLLKKYLPDAQVAFAANDDYKVEGTNSIQISEFESDNRADDHLRKIWLVGNGGGNSQESYELILYAAARKVSLDSIDKRGKKGYLFMYADERIPTSVLKGEVKDVFGDALEADIPVKEIIEEAQRNFNVFLLWPHGGYIPDARAQYEKLFGEDNVITLEDPSLICEVIASTIGLFEDRATPASLVTDLVAVGVSDKDAKAVSKSLKKIEKGEELAVAGGGKKAKRV